MMDGSCFYTRNAYASLSTQLRDHYLEFVLKSFVPLKVKIFSWLLVLDQLNTRENLHHKTIIDTSACPRCDHPVESRDHLFFHFAYAQDVWGGSFRFNFWWMTSTMFGLHPPLPAFLPRCGLMCSSRFLGKVSMY
jgi:hypothetical protein